ncbi:MAG: hypothetical protein ACTSVW_04765 [Candidatus Njordarchaeales archaeon]
MFKEKEEVDEVCSEIMLADIDEEIRLIGHLRTMFKQNNDRILFDELPNEAALKIKFTLNLLKEDLIKLKEKFEKYLPQAPISFEKLNEKLVKIDETLELLPKITKNYS